MFDVSKIRRMLLFWHNKKALGVVLVGCLCEIYHTKIKMKIAARSSCGKTLVNKTSSQNAA